MKDIFLIGDGEATSCHGSLLDGWKHTCAAVSQIFNKAGVKQAHKLKDRLDS
jgi:hypothetical protein